MKRASGTSPYESRYGFSRAVRLENRIMVAGTGPVEPDGTSTPGNAATQARRCFAIAQQAIEELGGTLENVVRTRMYLTDPADADAVGRVHGETFGNTRPAATLLVVAALVRDDWLVEIEAEALVHDD